MNVFELSAKIALDTKEYLKGLQEAGDGASKLKDTITGAAAIGAKSIAALGTAAVAAGGMAVKGFSDFQQLSGGVETLFGTGGANSLEEYAKSVGQVTSAVKEEYIQLKNAENAVFENANKAYATAGMSANQYMDTITGFSATLISALDGDTLAAAEVGNRAVIAMSDNVNKMGTSMESVQYAYQGFAKGNYTMLDNLKLGFGGTQAEMQRLIAEASKMTDEQEKLGVTVDGTSMSFDNVINAIDVMQEHLGIAGATAAEARGTIEGSFNMMAASGKNLISALANPDADIGALVSTFVESTATFASNLLPTIDNLITGIGEAMPAIGQAFAAHGPEMMEQGMQIIHHLYNGIMTALPQMAAAAPQVIGNLATGFISNAPMLISSGVDLIVQLINGFSNAVPMIISAAPLVISTLLDAIVSNAPKLLFAGLGLISAIIDGLISAIPTIAAAGVQLVGTLLKGILGAVSSLILGGISMVMAVLDGGRSMVGNFIALANSSVGKLLQGILAGAGRLISSGVNMVKNVINGAKSAIGGVVSIGKNIVQGVWKGISGTAGWLGGKVTGFFKGIVNKGKSVLGIHSPSKVFQDEIGVYIALGVAEGIKKGAPKAVKAAEDLAKSVYEKSKAWIDKNKEEMELSLAEQLEVWNTIQGQFVEGSKQYADAEKEINSIRKGILEENKKLQEDYDKALEDRTKKIFDSYKLFEEVPKRQKVSGDQLVKNLEEQLAAITKFYENLRILMERTGNESLVNYIKEAGVSASAELEALVSMSDYQLDRFDELYREKQSLSKDLAKEDLSEMKKEMDKQVDINNKALSGKFETEAPTIGEQFSNGLAQGIKNGAAAVASAAEEVANIAVDTSKKALDIHSPSKVMENIGKMMSKGLAIGFVATMYEEVPEIRSVIDDITGDISEIKGAGSSNTYAASGGGGGNNIRYGDIYIIIEKMVGNKESIETLSQELDFLRKQKNMAIGI